jgi:hypothetical protein
MILIFDGQSSFALAAQVTCTSTTSLAVVALFKHAEIDLAQETIVFFAFGHDFSVKLI